MILEFFWSTDKMKIMVHDLESDDYFLFTIERHNISSFVEKRIREIYPETYEKLCQLHGRNKTSQFARVNRFVKCNFSIHDFMPDIDEDGNFALEHVPCPLRGTCKDAVCEPRITNELTVRECQIIVCHCDGLSQKQIGDRLFIAKSTVHNHVTNIYKKLGFTGQPRPDQLLTNYAYKNNLL